MKLHLEDSLKQSIAKRLISSTKALSGTANPKLFQQKIEQKDDKAQELEEAKQREAML